MTKNSPNQSYRLEGIAFGLADGLIMCLGLIIGVAEVTSDTRRMYACTLESKQVTG